MTRERKTWMRYTCDRCGFSVPVETPVQDYWHSDDAHPEGWSQLSMDSKEEDRRVRLDLCPACGITVATYLRERATVV